MRLLLLLAWALPLPALALGPAVLDSPDLRQLVAGPMVYGGSDGVTCTFAAGQPPRCSDGRLIATARASECMERAGDTWTTRPVNTACVDDDGMQVYQGFTNYELNSSTLTTGGWAIGGGAGSITPLADGFRIDLADAGSQVRNTLTGQTAVSSESWTATVEARGSGSLEFSPLLTRGWCAPQSLSGAWTRLSCTIVAQGSETARTYLRCADGGACSFELRQVQLTKTAYPMPRHDCGATACSRAPDLHTISTAGWPTTSGEICITATPGGPAGTLRWLIDGRAAGVNTSTRLYIRDTTNRFETTGPQGGLAGPVAVEGIPVRVCFGQRGGQAFLRVGASLTTAASTGPMSVEPNAFIGVSRSSVEHLNGTIRRLSWSPR